MPVFEMGIRMGGRGGNRGSELSRLLFFFLSKRHSQAHPNQMVFLPIYSGAISGEVCSTTIEPDAVS